jgi:hypothetical protein
LAGNYLDAPGHRMQYDLDGSVLSRIASDASITVYAPATLTALNNEDLATTPISEDYYLTLTKYALIFPELRDIIGVFAATSQEVFTTFETSTDTTNGFDGTWTARTPANGGSATGRTKVHVRNNIAATSLSGVKAVRWGWDPYDANQAKVHVLHLYGTLASGESPDRLRIWHPTLDQEVGPAHFDWGNVPRGSSADKTFRLKNNSSTLTAGTISVSIEAPTNTTPSVSGQHTFSTDGTTFGATASLATLAPGALSPVITLRRVTPTNAALALWWARVIATAAFWT